MTALLLLSPRVVVKNPVGDDTECCNSNSNLKSKEMVCIETRKGNEELVGWFCARMAWSGSCGKDRHKVPPS